MMLLLVLSAVSGAAPAPLTLGAPTGRLELAHGVLSAPMSGDLRAAALRFAESRRSELGVPATSTLRVVAGYSTRFGASVHVAQQLGGLDIHGAKVIVTFDAARRVVRVASSVSSFERAAMNAQLSGPEALAIASRTVEGALLRDDGTPWGGYDPRAFVVGDEVHTGFFVYVPTVRRTEAWYAAVDATDGTVLWSADRARAAATTARVYASHPASSVGPSSPTVQVELAHLTDGGTLTGTQIRAFNCCPTVGCSPDAGPRTVTGLLQQGGGAVPYSLAICDRVQRATNEPSRHASGDFVYDPVDPPTTSRPSLQSAADSDEFAEVHGYYHVDRATDFVRELSVGPFGAAAGVTPFEMRDLGRGKVPAIWTNPSEPDFQQATQNAQGTYVSTALTRVSNAMFVPLESMLALSVPEYAFDSDGLIVYQGDDVDFVYDGPVVWHEFGHGVASSTANWNPTVAIDRRSANLESQAIEEGSADVLAFMIGNRSKIGEYVSPRTGTGLSLRDANNSLRCPDVLWGESHQDGQHYAGAIWHARSTLFQGSDQGHTFDAAYYAALVSFPTDVTFDKAAAIISASVGQAFPGIADAEQKMKAVFDDRGITNCSKVLAVQADEERAYYGLFGSDLATVTSGTAIPGPYQLKLHVPNGAKQVTMSGVSFSFGGGGGGSRLQLLAKAGAPITFTRAGSTLTNDADAMVVPTSTRGTLAGTVTLAVPCGGDVYVTLANTGARDRIVQQLSISATPADSCPPPAEPDAGVGDGDAGVVDAIIGPAVPEALGPPLGCGCSSGAAAALWAIPLALWPRRRRS
ncbi:MAG: hypothetical protein JNG84_05220 [Archangium sp.]|nr:hypothetical protein [Archangium sp.]